MNIPRSLLIVTVLLVVVSCSDNEQVTTPVDTPGVLTGRVVDSEDSSKGMGGATVRVEGTDHVVVTDDDGYFEFTGLDDGDVIVVVEPESGTAYQSNRVDITIHSGATVDVNVTVLPGDAELNAISIYPQSARIGILESVQFYAGGVVVGLDSLAANEYEIDFRPTWTIRSEKSIGVISREGIFIGTATGHGEVIASFSDELQVVAEIDVVTDSDIARIHIFPYYSFRVEAGASHYLAACAVNGAGNVVENAALLWDLIPEELGTIAPVTDLSPEEQMEIYEQLLMERWFDYYPDTPEGDWEIVVDTVSSDSGDISSGNWGGGMPPVDPPPTGSYTIDPEDVSLVLFTASSEIAEKESGSITVQPEGEIWTSSVDVQVYARGELADAYLLPEEISLPVGSDFCFFACGLNEWGQTMDQLEYEWDLSPASLGSVDEIEFPWWGAGDSVWGGVDPTDSMSGDRPGWPPIDDGGCPVPSQGGSALFHADEEGSGEITVTIHDPVANLSIVRSASIEVTPPPVLEKVEIYPSSVDAAPGDSILIHATALNDMGDIDWTAQIEWVLTGQVGSFTPYIVEDIPGDDDSLYWHNGSTEPVPPDGPFPHNRGGISYGVFIAGTEDAEGTLKAEAVSEDGVIVSVEVPVRVISR